MENTLESVNDRIQLPFHFDVEKLQTEVTALTRSDFYIYYKVLTLRGPAHQIDPSKPLPPAADDYADGTWCDWLDTSDLKKSPYLMEVVNFFKKHTTVNLVRLLRLEQQGIVKEHTDPTLAIHIEKSMVRLTIPIFNTDEKFYLNKTLVPLQPGECWYMRLSNPHYIENGATERINLTIDIIPNDWLKSFLLAK